VRIFDEKIKLIDNFPPNQILHFYLNIQDLRLFKFHLK